MLVQLQELKDLEEALKSDELQLSQMTTELTSLQQAAEKYNTLNQRYVQENKTQYMLLEICLTKSNWCRYEMMSHELAVVKARLATTSDAQTHAEIEALREEVFMDLTFFLSLPCHRSLTPYLERFFFSIYFGD